MTDDQRDVLPLPLERQDPPALGGIELAGRLASTDSGVVYAGWSGGQPVAVVLLNEGAETDSYARARFQQATGRAAGLEIGSGPDPDVVAADSDVDIAPWVALRADTWTDGLGAAQALLAPVAMEHLAPIGEPAGPAFRPHWSAHRRAGRWRMWPLPWPTALTAASRWTYLAAFALVLAIAAIALWIAVKIFENQPPVPPGPGPGPLPIPTPTSPSPSSPSPSPSTGPSPTTGPGSPGGTGTTTAPPIV